MDIKPLLLTRPQVAKILGLSERTIATLTKQGELQVVRLGCRSVRYSIADVERFARGKSQQDD